MEVVTVLKSVGKAEITVSTKRSIGSCVSSKSSLAPKADPWVESL